MQKKWFVGNFHILSKHWNFTVFWQDPHPDLCKRMIIYIFIVLYSLNVLEAFVRKLGNVFFLSQKTIDHSFISHAAP